MLVSMAEHTLDPNEQVYDHRVPGLVTVQKVTFNRGQANPPGVWVEDAEVGSIMIVIQAPADDRTPADKMGYRIRIAGGVLPEAGMVPVHDVRAIVNAQGERYLVLYWNDGATNVHEPVSLILSVAAVDLGGNVGGRTYLAACDPPAPEAPVDVLSYDPAHLQIKDEEPNGWLLEGSSRMKMFASQEDALNGLAVARRYRGHGFVGRNNARPNRRDYIVEYWTGSSGLPWQALSKTDRISFHASKLFGAYLGADGWSIRDGASMLLTVDNANDAAQIMQVMQAYRWMCFIGRDNHRPDRKAYIMTYWE